YLTTVLMPCMPTLTVSFFFQAEDGIRDRNVTGVQTCALPISYHFDSQSLIIPTLRPIGFILFPTDYPSFFSVTTTVTCLVRLFILLALPCARGRKRLSVAPSPTYTSDTIKFSGSNS